MMIMIMMIMILMISIMMIMIIIMMIMMIPTKLKHLVGGTPGGDRGVADACAGAAAECGARRRAHALRNQVFWSH